MTAIRIDNLDKTLGGTHVLRSVSLELPSGSRTLIVGRSGTGKSTLLRIIAGLEHADRGTIELDGQLASKNATVITPPQMRQVAMVFQDLGLWEHMTVAQHLKLVLAKSNASRMDRKQRANALLGSLEIDRHAHKRPHQLSGGEQQRLAIARALATKPRILLLDEPLSHVDAELRETVLAVLEAQIERHRPTVLYVTHDPTEGASLHAGELRMEDLGAAPSVDR